MKKFAYKLLAVMLCLAMLCTGTAFAAPAGEHDHDQALIQTRAGVLREEGGGEPTVEPQPEPQQTSHVHNYVQGAWLSTDNWCTSTYTEYYQEVCSICGDTRVTALRPYGNATGNVHDYVESEVQDSECSGRKLKKYTCQKCASAYIDYSNGYGHAWSDWVAQGNKCTDPDVRTCSLCGATENRNANRVHTWGPVQRRGSCTEGWTLYRVCTGCKTEEVTGHTTGHTWESFREPSDCTHTGRAGQRCKDCGAEQNVYTLSISHSPNADDGDCRTAVTCSKCGVVTTPAKSSHTFGNKWAQDDEGHWKVCQNLGCKATSGKAGHSLVSGSCTLPATCNICGYKSGTALYTSHDFSGDYVIDSTSSHRQRCVHPGCTTLSAPIAHTPVNDTPDRPCTETVVCACGYPIRRGASAHTWGPWTATGNGHTHTCTKCGATETGSHTGSTKGSCTTAVTCTVCGHVLVHAYSSHSFGVWISSGSNSGHYRTCSRPGCTAVESTNHSGGTATCKSQPICSACGAKYGSKSASNHTGGTELKNYKAPSESQAGYTGDTVCLGCGATLEKGTTIAMLAPDHTHKYGGWESDSLHHWKMCSCSERSEYASHSFVNGACSVCGAKDPNYKVCSGSLHVGGTEVRDARAASVGVAGYTGDTYCTACGSKISSGNAIPALEEDHIHNFSSGWKSDGKHHWHECSCGQHSAQAAHTYGASGRCVYCGALDPSVQAQQEVHVHTYGALVSNGQDHWRECSVCGEQADRSHHMILDGKCMDCGYVKVDTASFKDLRESDWYYESVRRVLETGLIADVEGDRFEPEAAVDRGQVADILYRMAGSPVSDGSSEFEDVSEQEAYVNAISWAAGNSIMEGSDAAFNPGQNATVGEIITSLWRYAAMLNGSVAPAGQDALEWAEQNGLMAGYAQQPDPAGEATRTDVAVLVANFMQSMRILSDESPTDMA